MKFVLIQGGKSERRSKRQPPKKLHNNIIKRISDREIELYLEEILRAANELRARIIDQREFF